MVSHPSDGEAVRWMGHPDFIGMGRVPDSDFEFETYRAVRLPYGWGTQSYAPSLYSSFIIR